MITISKPKTEDAEAIHNMMKASWYATYPNKEIGITKEDGDASYIPEVEEKQIEVLRYRAENPKDSDISLVAKDNNKVVGFIRLKVHPESIEWLSLYAHPDYFGKGIGTALWKEAQKSLPPNKPITVEVASYTKAVNFYKKLGFVDIGEVYVREGQGMPVSGTHIPLMKLVLEKQYKNMSEFKHKKIMILGDSGRGKSTFAEKLSKKIDIPHYSTDNFFWKTRFTIPNDREKSIEEISHIYDRDKWIMEGGTRHLILKGLEKAEIIYYLTFKNILYQYYFLIRRNLSRNHENFTDLFNLLKHITYKKYKKNYGNHLPRLEELLEPYKNKVVRLTSIKEINRCLKENV